MICRKLRQAVALDRCVGLGAVLFVAGVVMAVAEMVQSANAGTFTWTGVDDSNWNTNSFGLTNWSPNSVPPANSDIDFSGFAVTTAVNLQTAQTINSLTFDGVQNYTLSNGSLVISTGNITVSVEAPIATNQTVAVPVTLGAAGTFTVASPATLTLTQAISDGTNSYGLTLAGTGTTAIQGTGNSVFTLNTNGGGLVDVNGGAITVRDTNGGIYDTSLASSMTLRNGGKFAGSGGNLQINGGTGNTLTIDGTGSSITGLNLLTVGNSGTPANFQISNGATISNVSALTVAGLDTSNITCVATIESAAQVSTGSGSIGAIANAVGSVTVKDAGTLWQMGTMSIGGYNDTQNGGTGTLTVTNSGQVTVTGNTKFYTTASTLIVDKGSYSTAQLQTAAGATPTIQIDDLTGKSALTITNTNLSLTNNFAGTIVDGTDGAGSVTKTGGGSQILSGHNTYTGGTTVSGGTLQLGIEDALAATGAVTVNNGATLDLGGHDQTIGNLALANGTVTGATGSTLSGNTFSVASGSIAVPVFGTTFSKTSGNTVTDSALITASVSVGQGILDAEGGIQGNVNISSNAQLKASGTLTGTLGSSTNGTLTLTGGTTVTGTTTLLGTLDVNSQSIVFTSSTVPQVSSTTISGGVISAPNGYAVSSSLSGFGTVVAAVSGSGVATKTITASGGTLALGTFAAADSLASYAGNLVAGTAQLDLESSGYTSLGNSATIAGGSINSINGVQVNSGKTLSGFGTVSGPLNNLGTVTGGTGTNVLHLSGAVTGTGSFKQNVSFDGSYSPGNGPATVSISGNTTFGPASQLFIELGGTTAGTQYDRIADTGTLNLNGTLNVSLINGFRPLQGESFDILNWGSLNGTFNSVSLPTLGGRIVWDSSQLYASGVLTVTGTFFAGDFNRDGHVDASDIAPMMMALANIDTYEATYAPGISSTQLTLLEDVNGDGAVNNADLQALLTLLKSGGGSAAAVPEPSGWALAIIAGISIFGWHISSGGRSSFFPCRGVLVRCDLNSTACS